MKRRLYLALVGMGMLTGCSGGESGGGNTSTSAEPDGADNTPTSSESTPTESPTATETPTETETPEPFSEIAVEKAEVVTIERSYSDEIGAEVAITNNGNTIAPNFEIGVDWFDENGEYIATSSIYGQVLETDERYIARIPAYLDVENPEEVEAAEATVADDNPFGEYNIYPEGVEVAQSTTRASEEDVVVRGVIENNRDTTEFLEYGAKVYNGAGDVIGIGEGIEEVSSGESWRFENSVLTGGRNGQVESGKVIPYI